MNVEYGDETTERPQLPTRAELAQYRKDLAAASCSPGEDY
jgi:hypothetical protein